MATREEREKLLAKTCGWCGAVVNELCHPVGQPPGTPLTTMEAGCHDTRWVAAVGRPGRVMVTDAETGHRRVVEPPSAAPEREPVPVGHLMPAGLTGAAAASGDRPW